MTVNIAIRFDMWSNNRTIIRQSFVSIGNDIIVADNRGSRSRVIVERISGEQPILAGLKIILYVNHFYFLFSISSAMRNRSKQIV